MRRFILVISLICVFVTAIACYFFHDFAVRPWLLELLIPGRAYVCSTVGSRTINVTILVDDLSACHVGKAFPMNVGFGYSMISRATSPDNLCSRVCAHAPIWAFLVLSMLVSALGAWRIIRARTLQGEGHVCRNCGYDLRGCVDGRCSECGRTAKLDVQ